MIPLPTTIYMAVQPVDMRLGADGLALQVQLALGCRPFDGSAYLFRNRRGNRIKVLVCDGQGLWLCQRRLHQGAFVWAQAGEATVTLSETQWRWLVAGVDWQRLSAAPPGHWRV